MIKDYSSARLDVFYKRFLSGFGPIISFIVYHHYIIVGKVRIECLHITAFGRRCGNINCKQARILKILF